MNEDKEQAQATAKVFRIRAKMTDAELSDIIGITKNTLYKRLSKQNPWKKSEIILIKQLNENELTR